MQRLVIGFDLDMTLIDSRPGIQAVYTELAARTGVPIDAAAAVTRLGPPLEEELARWFPPNQVDAAGDQFRALYPDLAVASTPALPGAAAALGAVQAGGGRAVVITAKYEPNARLHLDALGLPVDELIGWRWGDGKRQALTECGAAVYVGDHVGDVRAAADAGVTAVAVATGPCSPGDLAAAGASVVLTDLTEFPAWLEHWLSAGQRDWSAAAGSAPAGTGLAASHRARFAELRRRVADLGSVLVAFSGGVDSSLVLAVAAEVLGTDHVVAATAVSPALPAAELAVAQRLAHQLGVRHLTPATNELSRAGYVQNAGDRCAFCKSELLEVLAPLAARLGLSAVATGTNADDAAAGFRPGIAAAARRGATTPLLDAGLGKAQVRAIAHALGLATWDKPAVACLASRIAYGVPVTRERLERVARAEVAARAALAAAGVNVRDLRVRDLGDNARVEVDPGAVVAAGSAKVLGAVAAAGFAHVEVDPAGFRSGSMNEMLADPQRYR